MTPRDSDPTPAPRRSGRRTRTAALGLAGVLLLTAVIPALLRIPAVNGLFAEETITGCTVGNPAEARVRGKGRSLAGPRIRTDCGTFRSPRETACSADAGRQVHLVSGVRYDLIVRGPDLPPFAFPAIVSARVSAEQPPEAADPFAERTAAIDEQLDAILDALSPERRAELEAEIAAREAQLAEDLAPLEAQLAPETLRAFDYEQPEYAPSCDASRRIMTSAGIQIMSPARGAELLRLPAGVTPREPLLPCEGYGCPEESPE